MTIEEWDRTLKGMSRAEYAAEKRRRARRERLETAFEVAGVAAVLAIFAAAAWLFLAATPDQSGADGLADVDAAAVSVLSTVRVNAGLEGAK